MGIKKFFKTKPPSEEEVNSKVRDEMNENGIPIKSTKQKPKMFSAYSKYANDKSEKKVYAPQGYEEFAVNNRGEKVITPGQGQDPYETDVPNGANGQMPPQGNGNPYANTGASNVSGPSSSNPYATMGSNNSYNSSSNASSNPYANMGSNNSGGNVSQRTNMTGYNSQQPQSSAATARDPYAQNSYGSGSSAPRNPYSSKGSSYTPSIANKTAVEEDDFNTLPDNASTRPPSYRQQQVTHPRDQQQQGNGFDFEEDLNEDVPREEDEYYQQQQAQEQQELELTPEELEDLRKQREEDEEVEGIKNQIRFTKQESVASTRNTLTMAREAEESGKNTMGMLGSQSETIFNVERNLDLAKTQDRIAKEKVQQLNHYNRHILKPSVQNPFTKSKRLREKEERIKNDRLQFKLTQEQQRRELSNSTNRIKSSLNDKEQPSESIGGRYKREKHLKEAKQYQFENDSEDDEMEAEIGDNLDEVSKIAGRLKKLAMNQGDEIERQNYRLRNVDEDMTDLDINVHLNTTRLSGTR